MTKSQEEHLKRIKESFNRGVDVKYRAGAKEHTGHLKDNPYILDEIRAEAIDLYTYVATEIEKKEDECRKRVYVSAPFRNKDERKIIKNIERALKYADVISKVFGYTSIEVVHTEVPKRWGIKAANTYGGKIDKAIIRFNLKRLKACKVLFVCGDQITQGMWGEIGFAVSHRIDIRFLPEKFFRHK